MTYNIFFISDTHFGHEAPYVKFRNPDDTGFLRPHGSATAGDEAMVENWNKVVKPEDRLYHLGDVVMSKKFLPILSRLNGRKVLIKGNHDQEKLSIYAKYFEDIRGVYHRPGMVMSHVPLHPGSIDRWGINVHGHLHGNRVRDEVGNIDTRYFSVCVEQINYTPIALEELRKQSGI